MAAHQKLHGGQPAQLKRLSFWRTGRGGLIDARRKRAVAGISEGIAQAATQFAGFRRIGGPDFQCQPVKLGRAIECQRIGCLRRRFRKVARCLVGLAATEKMGANGLAVGAAGRLESPGDLAVTLAQDLGR